MPNKVKASAGIFDGGTATGNSRVLGAARVRIDFRDPEDGYNLNGTCCGDKRLLAIGGATQIQAGQTASTIDFLLEKKLPGGHAEFTHGTGVNYDRKTAEINFHYVMKQFGARVMTFCGDRRFNRVQANTWHAGVRSPDPDVKHRSSR